MTAPLRCIGIDPGTLRLGWGVIDLKGTALVHVAHGVIRMKDGAPLGERLVVLEKALVDIVQRHQPTVASVESIFFAKDASATAKLGHARGVAMLVCVRAGMEMFEYPPSRVKRTIAGSGKADKAQVARMMMAYLRLTVEPPADAADALAVSATHLQSTPFRALAESSGAVVRRIG